MTPGIGQLLLRADGGPEIGLGHVMRCLALAQAWRDAGGSAMLVYRHIPQVLAERFNREGIECVESHSEPGSPEDASHLAELAAGGDGGVVLDGYLFDAPYQHILRREARTLLVIDDHGQIGEYHADHILDQNLRAKADSYLRRPED